MSEQHIKQNRVVQLDQLVPHARNFRVHPQSQIDKLVMSLQRFGQGRSIVIQDSPEKMIIVAGHGIVEAAQALQWTELRADILPAEWSDEQITGYLVADNLHAQDASDNDELLALLLKEQQDAGFDLRSLGTDDESLRQMLEAMGDGYLGGGEREEGEGGDEFDVTPQEGPTRSNIGDIWQLGPHRILCGDSTDRDAVRHLLAGEKAILVHADPPYGMGKEKEGVANDNLYNEKLDAFQMQWWRACRPCLEDNASVYIWGNAEDLWRLWYEGGLKQSERMTLRNEIVWDKGFAQQFALMEQGNSVLRSYNPITERCIFFMLGEQGFNTNADNYWEGWEPIRSYLEQERITMGWDIPTMKRIVGHSDLSRDHWTSRSQWSFPTRDVYEKLQQAAQCNAFKRDYDDLKRDYDDLKRDFYATRAYFENTHENMTDVWNYPRVQGQDRYGHPTPKPVLMIERIIKTSCASQSLIYDPFLGSGPILVGVERVGDGRKVYGCEINPAYVDICLRRYEAETGQTATLLERIEVTAK